MSETLIPGYYNTKINNHDWTIYMGGERYFPAYPAKWIEPEPPEPEKKIVKRYLVRDSSKHGYYDILQMNSFPLTLSEAYINENDETMEFDGNTYYVWRGWNQLADEVEPDEMDLDNSHYEQLIILTTSLEPTLPFTRYSSEFAYMLTTDSKIDETEYIASDAKYTFIAQVDEYEDGERKVKMANVGVRMYNFEHSRNLFDDYEATSPIDYFQYDGEIVDYEGQRCFVWNRYDTNRLCTQSGWGGQYNLQKILTNTLWISSLPFTMDSPEFVVFMNDDTYIDFPSNIPFDRIEYLPDNVYEPNPIDMKFEEVETDVNINVYTRLWTNNEYEDGYFDYYDYYGETMEWEGELCYVWILSDNEYDEYSGYMHKVLTNTLNIKLPLTENSPEYVVTLDNRDDIPTYEPGTMRTGVRFVREYGKEFNPPVYKKIIVVK